MNFNQAAASPFFKVAATTRRRFSNYYSGQRGVDFSANTDATITKLARGLEPGKKALSETSRVSLYDASTKQEVAHVDVGPSATCKDGYCWAALDSPVKMKTLGKYRLVQRIWRGMKDRYNQVYLSGSSLSASFNSKFAKFNGLVQVSNAKDFPDDKSISRGQGMGIVNFDVLENDGCGPGSYTCTKNHTCFKKEVKGFVVEAGPCVATADKCVTSSNFGKGNYPNNEKCTIKTPEAGTLKVTNYYVEHGYDYLTIDGTAYQYGTPPAKVLTASKSVSWVSDGSVVNKGFKMCMVGSLLLDEEEPEDSEAQELNEAELSELSEEERQHAMNKYQQRREEIQADKNEVEAAEEQEKKDDEMQAMQDAGSLLESETQEVQYTELDEDELALPDLSSEA